MIALALYYWYGLVIAFLIGVGTAWWVWGYVPDGTRIGHVPREEMPDWLADHLAEEEASAPSTPAVEEELAAPAAPAAPAAEAAAPAQTSTVSYGITYSHNYKTLGEAIGTILPAQEITSDRPFRRVADLRIEPVSANHPQVRDLISFHLQRMQASSPPGSVFALDFSGYDNPALTLWGAWRDAALAGMIALQRLDGGIGEIKSMRTHPGHLRLGVAQSLLEHLINTARAEGLVRLSLETGSGKAFEPALALYRRRGFANGPAFGGYEASDFNQFLHLELSQGTSSS